jgi:hypothetical protein
MNFRLNRTLSLLAASAVTGLFAPAAWADDFLVTNILNAGAGSLRSAIEAANNNPGHDTVSFHPAVSGNIQLSEVIWVNDRLTIIGSPDGSIGFDTAGAFTPFGLLVQASEFGLVDLQFTNCPSAFSVHGHLRINLLRCSFVDNGGSSWGGVINQSPASQYRLSGIVQSCSFINNVGIYAGIMVSATPLAGDTLDFINCTICNNSGTHGAGVYNIFTDNPNNTGTIRVINCTVTGNSGGVNSTAGFGTFHRFGGIEGQGSLLVRNSVFAENSSGDDEADPNFTGFTAQSLSLVGANILSDAQLEPLSVVASRHVRIPLPGSSCIDAAMTDSTVRADQLGTLRPYLAPGAVPAAGSNGADIGAIEFVPVPCAADFDGSGVVGVPDIFAFLSAWFAGCP